MPPPSEEMLWRLAWRIVINLGILALIGAATWWLTGFDKNWAGESKSSHHLTRALRCVGVLFLSILLLVLVQTPGASLGESHLIIVIAVGIGLILRSPLSEVFTHGFLGFLDPDMHDKTPFDPQKALRYQDTIGHLIRTGQRDAAIKLCEELKKTGEVDINTLENHLIFLGVPQQRAPEFKPLVEAGRLRSQGNLLEAEKLLKAMLAKNPADEGAALMLMRLLAQDLKQPDRAYRVYYAFSKQPHVSPDHLEFARRHIEEWSRPAPAAPETPAPAPPETVEDLLAKNSYGIAVEKLEAQIREQPQDFALQLKLADIYATHIKNFPRAEKIVKSLERSPEYSPELKAEAAAKLQQWRAANGGLHGHP